VQAPLALYGARRVREIVCANHDFSWSRLSEPLSRNGHFLGPKLLAQHCATFVQKLQCMANADLVRSSNPPDLHSRQAQKESGEGCMND
jgi:hypothetical protein